MKTFILCLSLLFLCSCSGCGVNVMQKIDASIPNAEFEEFTLTENFGPAVNFSLSAKNAKKTGEYIEIEEITYNRAGNVTSAHFELKGYKRRISE